MDWKEAREGTLRQWRGIRAAVDRRDEIELLTEINALCDLCTAAKQAAPEELNRCENCAAYQQFGGCREVNATMSLRVVEKDWDGLLQLIDEFVAHVQTLRIPQSGSHTKDA